MLGCLLCLGGLLEYVVMSYVHSSFGQWRLPDGDTVSAESPFRPYDQLRHGKSKASLSGGQGDALYRRYLESIGKEKMLALQQVQGNSVQVPSSGPDKGNEKSPKKPHDQDFFYEQRDDLLRNIDKKMAHLGELHLRLSASIEANRDTDTKRVKMVAGENRVKGIEMVAGKGDSDYAGSRHIEFGFKGLHFNNEQLNDVHFWETFTESPFGPEILVENDSSLTSRELSPDEAAGNDILLTLRTIKKYHDKRLPLLFDTWLSKVNKSNVFLMTDDRDPVWQKKVWRDGRFRFSLSILI